MQAPYNLQTSTGVEGLLGARRPVHAEAAWGARESHNATKQFDMQLSASAANLTDGSSRELSCKHSETGRRANMSRARNLVQRLSLAIRDPF